MLVLQFCNTIQANILSTLNVPSTCTITDVTPGSVKVANTVAFTGSDLEAATAAQKSLASKLETTEGITSVYGSGYGTVTVSSIKQDSVSNPSELLTLLCSCLILVKCFLSFVTRSPLPVCAADKTSGAASVGMAWTVGVALMISALVMTV